LTSGGFRIVSDTLVINVLTLYGIPFSSSRLARGTDEQNIMERTDCRRSAQTRCNA